VRGEYLIYIKKKIITALFISITFTFLSKSFLHLNILFSGEIIFSIKYLKHIVITLFKRKKNKKSLGSPKWGSTDSPMCIVTPKGVLSPTIWKDKQYEKTKVDDFEDWSNWK